MKVKITKQALDDLKRIMRGNRNKALDIISIIEHELVGSPFIGKKLKGRYKDLRSYRVGDYRVAYSVVNDTLEVKRVEHRKDVYRK